MTDLVPIQVDGVTVYVEASGRAPTGERSKIKEAAASDVGKRALVTAEELSGSIQAFCGRVIRSLRLLGEDSRPTRAEIEFGINISAEGNVYVVKGTGEASLRIKAEWDLVPERK